MPRMLVFQSFQTSNFSGGGGMTPDPLAKGALRPLVNTITYSSQTGCLLQTLLKPLGYGLVVYIFVSGPGKVNIEGKYWKWNMHPTMKHSLHLHNKHI